jgi:hypothetical protein
MMILVPSVELKDEAVRAPLGMVKARIYESFVFTAGMALFIVAMTTRAPEETPIEPTGSLDVFAHDEGLHSHRPLMILCGVRVWKGASEAALTPK